MTNRGTYTNAIALFYPASPYVASLVDIPHIAVALRVLEDDVVLVVEQHGVEGSGVGSEIEV